MTLDQITKDVEKVLKYANDYPSNAAFRYMSRLMEETLHAINHRDKQVTLDKLTEASRYCSDPKYRENAGLVWVATTTTIILKMVNRIKFEKEKKEESSQQQKQPVPIPKQDTIRGHDPDEVIIDEAVGLNEVTDEDIDKAMKETKSSEVTVIKHEPLESVTIDIELEAEPEPKAAKFGLAIGVVKGPVDERKEIDDLELIEVSVTQNPEPESTELEEHGDSIVKKLEELGKIETERKEKEKVKEDE